MPPKPVARTKIPLKSVPPVEEKPPEVVECCSTCDHFVPVDTGTGQGECHRFPPSIARVGGELTASNTAHLRWPMAFASESCGEWATK